MEQQANESEAPCVLVVDDEDAVRHVLSSFLSKKGCEVSVAVSAEHALSLLADSRFHVALVDIVLPGRGGMNLLTHIKQSSPDTEVVLITSYGSVRTAVAAIRRGAYDYLQKPFRSLDDIWQVVQGALNKREQSQRMG